MALMKLLRLPTEAELEQKSMDFEGFYQAFIVQTVAPFTAKVEVEDDVVDLDGYLISKADWFTIIEQ